MLLFVLDTFRLEDVEVQNIHLPLILCAVIELLEDLSRRNPRSVKTLTFRAAMNLLDKLVACTPVVALTSPLQLTDFAYGGSFDDAACVCCVGCERLDCEIAETFGRRIRWK